MQIRRSHSDESAPLQWPPANSGFGLFATTIAFLAVAFERFRVSATREGEPRSGAAAVAAGHDAFVRHEARHGPACSHSQILPSFTGVAPAGPDGDCPSFDADAAVGSG